MQYHEPMSGDRGSGVQISPLPRHSDRNGPPTVAPETFTNVAGSTLRHERETDTRWPTHRSIGCF